MLCLACFIPVDETCALSAPAKTKTQEPEPDGGRERGLLSWEAAWLVWKPAPPWHPVPLAASGEAPQEPTPASGRLALGRRKGEEERTKHPIARGQQEFSLPKRPISPEGEWQALNASSAHGDLIMHFSVSQAGKLRAAQGSDSPRVTQQAEATTRVLRTSVRRF